MIMCSMGHDHGDKSRGENNNENWLFSRTGLVTIGFLLITGFLIYRGHTAHLLGFLPYLLILACPLMHIFMHKSPHRGHRHEETRHDEGKNIDESDEDEEKKKKEKHHYNHDEDR